MTASQRNTASVVAIIALAILSGFLIVDRTQIKSSLEAKDHQLSEINSSYQAVDAEFTLAKAELDKMKGDNAELDALIETQKAELDEQKSRISGLIRKNKSLNNIESELAEVRKRVTGYIAEIETLRDQNQMLAQENFSLQKNNQILTEQYTAASSENQELVSARAVLMSEKEMLLAETNNLASKVERASALTVDEIDVQGYKVRNSGKLAKKDRASKVNLLQVCFTTAINNIVEAGDENFYVRIVNPIGETLALEEKGSGATMLADGQEVRYTQATLVPYEDDQLSECISWNPELPFQKGTYQVFVYNKGYEVGKSTFKLK